MILLQVRIFADSFLPNDGNCLPTGEVRAVSGPMDLREPTPIGRGIGDADGGIGYDHNYCLRNDEGGLDARGLRRAAWLRSDATGLEMNVLTTEPGKRRPPPTCTVPRRGAALPSLKCFNVEPASHCWPFPG